MHKNKIKKINIKGGEMKVKCLY